MEAAEAHLAELKKELARRQRKLDKEEAALSQQHAEWSDAKKAVIARLSIPYDQALRCA